MSASPATPLVSVVVVNFNGRRHLERCLPALFATTRVEFEVIVADNGSRDGSVEWLAERWPQARVLALGRNLGFGRANGRGVQVARGEFVAFLNNDTVVEPGWLTALIEPMRADPEIAASCATLRLLEFPELLNARGGTMTSAGYGYDIDFMVPVGRPPLRDAELPWRDVLFPTAAAALFRRDEFLALGGFDPAMFMYHEDVDLGLRYWLAGRRVVVCDRAVVYHAFGGTTHAAHGLAWRERLGMRHNVRTLLKCFRAVALARTLARIARVWRAHHALGQALAVCSWNLVHLPTTLLERRRVQRRKVMTEAELYRRGLISGAAWPPPPPQAPAQEFTAARADWLPTLSLFPGEASALGRLGPGWYAAEAMDGAAVRWTCGLASCGLLVEPLSSGTLEVEVTVRPGQPNGNITLSCNDGSVSARVHGRWTKLAVPVRAGSDGRLSVTLTSPAWVPHHAAANWDFRTLGCAVRAVRFVPDTAAEQAPEPRVSVVIPTFNRWVHLQETLTAMEAQTRLPAEVIVVDDGSTDGTWERLLAWRDAHADRLTVHCIHQENAKQGRARNRGLQAASGDVVVFLGDDIVPDPEFIAEHVACHARLREPAAVIGFTGWHREKVHVTPYLDFVNGYGPQFAFDLLRDGQDCPYTCFYTSNVSLPRAALGEEPFDPAFTSYGWEDVELGYRLSRRGLRIVYCRAASARHAHPGTMADFLRRQRQVGRAVPALLALHPELDGDLYMPPRRPSRSIRALIPWLPVLVPPLTGFDAVGVRLPRRVYGALTLASYFAGHAESADAGAGRP